MAAHAHTVKRYPGFWGWLWDWLTTVDHKKIGILYLVAGTTMIFLAAMPIIFALMNAVVPLQIGARDVAFPFVNALGFWTFFFGGLLLNIAWLTGEVPDAGWTAYPPLSTTAYSSHHGVDYFVLGLQISGIGSLLGGINFMATIINLRAPGMTFMRMPMFTWASFITSALIVFAFPALTVGLVAMMFDRIFAANFFDVNAGGNIVLWEHIFWLFGHPEVYILILPAFGIISEVISTFSRKRLFGYSTMVFATILIAFLGFMVWAHHMFTTGLGPVANAIFSIATMAIAVPTGIKVFNWLLTMWGGSIRFTAANLFAIGFIPTFVMGGVTGVMLASAPADFQYHDSYFVVAHFHYTIVGGLVTGLFAGIHYWWPKMFGRMLHEGLGKLTFWTYMIGFHLTFFVQHFLGLLGMPRRVATYLPNQGFDTMNLVSTIGAILMAFGILVFIINVVVTSLKPRHATNDPWEDGRTLEWAIPSPAPEYNFKQIPLIRGLDAWWKEKMEGNKEMKPAEPVGPIHMPSPSILPFIMSVGLFISGFGFMYNLVVAGIGLAITLMCMMLRSVFDDHGYHIEPEEQKKKGEVPA